MGLRLWRDTDDDAVIAEDAAAKLDRAAAARRSPIRRETSIRPGRDHVPPQSISVFLRSRHQDMLRTRDRLRQEERQTDSQIAQLQAELQRLRRIRLRNRVRLAEEFEARGQDIYDSNPPDDQTNPQENAETTLESSLDTDRQSLPRPSRESNLRFELLPSSTSRSSSPWRYQVLSRTTMPSPPHSAGSDQRNVPIPEGRLPDGPIPGESWSVDHPRMPALTEGFAPARAVSHSTSQHHDSGRIEDEFQGLETPPPELWEGSYPPLQRVGHTSPQPQVDGLGDRRRSLSPFSDQNEEDTWMFNLLTTMETSQPTSASSFASSNGDSMRRSHNSSQTTSTSFGEIGSTDDTCELDLPEGITEDDVRTIRERHFSHGRRAFTDRQLMMALRCLREHMDRIGNTEYGMFQAILERMQRREPIPQDWWVTVGLPPDFGRRNI